MESVNNHVGSRKGGREKIYFGFFDKVLGLVWFFSLTYVLSFGCGIGEKDGDRKVEA